MGWHKATDEFKVLLCTLTFWASPHMRLVLRPLRLLLQDQNELLHPQSRIRDMQQISPDKLDRLQYATAGFTTRVLHGYGPRYHLLARPTP
jgi:hypothetical protein